VVHLSLPSEALDQQIGEASLASYHTVVVKPPVGGGLVFVPAEAVQPTDLTVEGLISIYVSMGISADQFLSKAPHQARG
jgi:uncharacterized membrane protein